MDIVYQFNFHKDMKKIKCRIHNQFYYRKVKKQIYKDIENLSFMPRAHKTLEHQKDPKGEYRRIVSGKHIIIYKIENNQIVILRVFSSKQNYLNSNHFILKENPENYTIIS